MMVVDCKVCIATKPVAYQLVGVICFVPVGRRAIFCYFLFVRKTFQSKNVTLSLKKK